MAGTYVTSGAMTAITAGVKTILTLESVATRRSGTFYFALSSGGTMADQVILATLKRGTVTGTGTAVVPAPTDPADPAAVMTSKEQMTVEGTLTAATELWEQDVHIRALAQVHLQPNRELVLPATAAAALAMSASSSNYTGIARATLHFYE